MKSCEVPGCGRRVHTDVLFCGPHWNRVPLGLRSVVNATWSNRRAALGGPQYPAAVREHEQAKQDAIEAVSGEAG